MEINKKLLLVINNNKKVNLTMLCNNLILYILNHVLTIHVYI